MTRLDNFNPSPLTRRSNVAPRAPRQQGINVRPNAPGITPIGPQSEAANRLARLNQALGGAGQVVQALGQAAERSRSQLRGRGVQHAREDLPLLQQQIRDGELTVPDDVDIEAFTEQTLAEQTEGLPGPMAEGYRDFLAPMLNQAFVSQQQQLKEQTVEDAIVDLTASAAEAESSGDIEAVVSEAQTHGIDESRIETEILIPAAEAAARGGANGRQTLEMLLSRLTTTDEQGEIVDEYPNELSRIRNIFRSTVQQQRQEEIDNATDPIIEKISRELNRAQEGQVSALANARRLIEQGIENDLVDQSKLATVQRRLRILDNETSRSVSESTRRNVAVEVEATLNERDKTAADAVAGAKQVASEQGVSDTMANQIISDELRRQLEFAVDADRPQLAVQIANELPNTVENQALVEQEVRPLVNKAGANAIKRRFTEQIDERSDVGGQKSMQQILQDSLAPGLNIGMDEQEARKALNDGIREQIEFAVDSTTQQNARLHQNLFEDLARGLSDSRRNRAFLQQQRERFQQKIKQNNDNAMEDATVQQFMQNPSAPLSTDLRPAFGRWLARNNIIRVGGVTDSGNVRFASIAAPERFGIVSARAHHILPDAATQITQAFSTAQSPETLSSAARTYAAIHRLNPSLSANLYSQMSETGQVRADRLTQALEQTSPPLLRTQGNQPSARANPDFAERVGEVIEDPQFLQVQPSNLDRNQRLDVLFEGQPPDDELTRRQHNQELIEQHLPDSLNNNFRFGFGRDVRVSIEAANRFEQIALRQIGTAMSTSDASPERIRQLASKKAADMLISERPPVLWNGLVTVNQRAPYPFDQNLLADMQSDLENAIENNRISEPFDTIEGNYRPSWEPNVTVSLPDGRQTQGGWALRDETGNPLTTNDGEMFIYVPVPGSGETFEQMRQRIIEQQAKREQQPPDRNVGGDIFMQGMDLLIPDQE